MLWRLVEVPVDIVIFRLSAGFAMESFIFSNEIVATKLSRDVKHGRNCVSFLYAETGEVPVMLGFHTNHVV